MRTETRPPERPSPPERPPPSKVLPYTLRVTLEAEVYDRLVGLARRDFRKLEWQASYLLTRAINELAQEAADAA